MGHDDYLDNAFVHIVNNYLGKNMDIGELGMVPVILHNLPREFARWRDYYKQKDKSIKPAYSPCGRTRRAWLDCGGDDEGDENGFETKVDDETSYAPSELSEEYDIIENINKIYDCDQESDSYFDGEEDDKSDHMSDIYDEFIPFDVSL